QIADLNTLNLLEKELLGFKNVIGLTDDINQPLFAQVIRDLDSRREALESLSEKPQMTMAAPDFSASYPTLQRLLNLSGKGAQAQKFIAAARTALTPKDKVKQFFLL